MSGKQRPLVFHVDGKPAQNHFRRQWEAARVAVGLPNKFWHDFRRTAVTRMENAGIARSLAMEITGHVTESIYTRYHIKNVPNIAAAMAKLSKVKKVRLARFGGGAA